jgi:hypothetical protein
MMDGMMMGCPGCSGWMMTGTILFGLLVTAVLILGAAALVRYLRS